MRSAIQVTQFGTTIVANPAIETIAFLSLEVKNSMTWTIGETLSGLFVQNTTIQAFPAFFANTRTVDTKSMFRTSWVRTIDFLAKISGKSFHTLTLAFFASSTACKIRKNVVFRNFYRFSPLKKWSKIARRRQEIRSSPFLKISLRNYCHLWHKMMLYMFTVILMKFILTMNVSDRNYSKIKINICWIFKLLKIRLSLRSFQIKLTRLPDISAQKLPKNLSKTSTKALFFGLFFLLIDGATIVRKKKVSCFCLYY